jgi:1-acyl-sn-glycerol-3-phosphate acyltransferase
VRPPPRWVRRVLLAPLVVVLALGLVVSSPLWLLATALWSLVVPGRLRPLRLIWLVTVYLAVEAGVLIAMFVLWLAAGFGWRVGKPAFQRAHYRLCGTALRVLYRAARWVLRLHVVIDGARPDILPADRPLVVLCRHAGPGDSFLLTHTLINWYERAPRIVLKATLQWDPAIDVLLNRLPNQFIVPGGDGAEDQIAALATDLEPGDALVIFPEGGNFTPERWERAVQRLRRLGFTAMARKAERMRNVLPPRPGGVLAVLDTVPDADVVLVGHTGVDHLRTVGDVWRELPMDKTIRMRWWRQPASGLPADGDARIEWLFAWWARIDAWIEENRVVPEAPAEPTDEVSPA